MLTRTQVDDITLLISTRDLRNSQLLYLLAGFIIGAGFTFVALLVV